MGVVTHGGFEYLDRHAYRACKDGYTVHALRSRYHPVGTDQPLGWLDADNIVQPCGHPARTSGVGSQCKVNLAGSNGIGRTRTGSARYIFRIERVGHGTPGGTGTVQATGKLVQVGFARQGRTSLQQFLHHFGVGCWRVGERGASGGGWYASSVNVVFDGKNQAGKRTPALVVG